MDTPDSVEKTRVLHLWEMARQSGYVDNRVFHEKRGPIDQAASRGVDPSTILVEAGLSHEQIGALQSLCDADASGKRSEGRRVGKYKIVGDLGAGGMGAVFKAVDDELGRTVALKVLRAEVSLMPGGSLDRFHIEARSLAKVKHPNIVMVYESGQIEGVPYIALEYVEGGSLVSRDYAKMDTTRKLEIGRDVARALAHAHQHDLIHRDVKPANILIRESGEAVLTDFGLVRDESTNVRLTQSVAWIGTPAYMSPEQAQGYTPQIGHRTDIYSLGVVLYEMFSGRLPFEDLSLDTLRDRITKEEMKPLRQVAKVSREIDAVVMKALERRPEERYQTAKQMEEDLDRLLKGETPSVRPPAWWRRAWARTRRRPLHLVAVGVATVLIGVLGALCAAPAGGGPAAVAGGLLDAADAAIGMQVGSLRAAARRIDVPHVGAALENYRKYREIPLDKAQAEVETELDSASKTDALLSADAVLVVDVQGALVLPRSPTARDQRILSLFLRGGQPSELVLDDGAGAWLVGAEAIRYPGEAEEVGGWTLVGERLSPDWFESASAPAGARFAWVAGEGGVLPAAGLTQAEGDALYRAAMGGATHAWVRGVDCAILFDRTHHWPSLVAVPDARWKRWAAQGFVVLAALGCLAIAFASLAAHEASRYAARYRAPQGGTLRRAGE